MIVANGCAHLAGGEVQNFLSGPSPYVAALRLLDDFRIDIAAIADQMVAKVSCLFALRTHHRLPAVSPSAPRPGTVMIRTEWPVAARKRSSSARGITIVASFTSGCAW